ncbi:sigma-70 family RNA polymerase sigma factor [Flavobacterium sp.]|uniref:RNA polymerase sigma factor n=1 Tax=Flavobacterium sp. TaxID=239 RepID=UPI00260CBAC0|nr:sigma-70 family RNA polymerase sigma factor [Flavobacterium sp.]
MSLEQLIHDCKKNDIKAQEQLYRQYAPKMFSVCLKYSRNYAEAQDNLQDGFLLVFDKINSFEFKGSFDGWIKRVILNHVLQQYRNKSFLSPIDEDIAEEVEVEIEDGVSMDFLMKIIQELPDRYRLVFNLSVFENYSHQEISDSLGISVGTSKSNLSRAKLILKEKIENNTGSVKMPSIK